MIDESGYIITIFLVQVDDLFILHEMAVIRNLLFNATLCCTGNASNLVQWEGMASAAVVSANVKTRQLVLRKMGPAIVPRQGGLGCSVISLAEQGTME